jgi:hypothetical protein
VLYLDYTNNAVGIGTTTPAAPLDVVGNVRTSGNYTFSTAKQAAWSIPGNGFKAAESSIHVWRSGVQQVFGTLTPSGATYPAVLDLNADVHLPQGATVLQLTCWYWDSDERGAELRSCPGADRHDGFDTAMASLAVDSVGASTTVQAAFDDTITGPVIDNQTNFYSLYTTTGGDVRTDQRLQLASVRLRHRLFCDPAESLSTVCALRSAFASRTIGHRSRLMRSPDRAVHRSLQSCPRGVQAATRNTGNSRRHARCQLVSHDHEPIRLRRLHPACRQCLR